MNNIVLAQPEFDLKLASSFFDDLVATIVRLQPHSFWRRKKQIEWRHVSSDEKKGHAFQSLALRSHEYSFRVVEVIPQFGVWEKKQRRETLFDLGCSFCTEQLSGEPMLIALGIIYDPELVSDELEAAVKAFARQEFEPCDCTVVPHQSSCCW